MDNWSERMVGFADFSLDPLASGCDFLCNRILYRANGQCGTYLHEDTYQDYADTYKAMAANLLTFKDTPGVSVSIYTQTTDVENECDGMVNMNRVAKFNASQVAEIKAANLALTTSF